MEERSVVARRLKEARVRAGLSQKQLGIKAGIEEFSASPRINQYERGKHTPDYGPSEIRIRGSRYALHAHPDVIALQFALSAPPEFKPRYNIAPTSDVLIVREDKERGRLADLYRWGLIPGWAKDPAIGNKMANARGETVAEKPSFRAAFKKWRCLVPASGFYIRPVGEELFGLTGTTELWNGA